MITRDFVLLVYKALGGLIRGKTTLQKDIYFLGELTDHKELGYGPHYYGPYSAEVAEANAELKSLGYLSESVAGAGEIGAGGFEILRHDYSLTPAGHRLAEKKKGKYAREWGRISTAARKLQNAGDIDYMQLSVAAKAYFVLTQSGGEGSLSDIRKMITRFGWKVTGGELEQAMTFLENVGLLG